jgi:hypothetical protein
LVLEGYPIRIQELIVIAADAIRRGGLSPQLQDDLKYALEILEKRPDARLNDIQDELDRDFFSKPGQHFCVGGRTRTGKTTLLYHIVDSILHFGKEHVAAWDTGKSAEFLTYALFQPLRILIPIGSNLKLDIEMSETAEQTLREKYAFGDEEIEQFHRNFDRSVIEPVDVQKGVWSKCRRGEIAVISVKRFFPDPDLYAMIIARQFKELIFATWDHLVDLPMLVVCDEAQRICPSRKNNEGYDQHKAGKLIGANLEEMASLGIRFGFGTQGWGKLRPTVRDSFEWIFVKRGIRFTRDVGRPSDFEPLWNKVPTTHTYIIRPDQSFTDPYRIPKYPEGWELGAVHYHGRVETVKKKPIIRIATGGLS